MKKWMLYTKKGDFKRIGERFGIDPVIARILRNRDLITEEEIETYLSGSIENTQNPRDMKDMEKAVGLLLQKVKEKKPIRIIGDYDIDGVSATYILYCGLKRIGGIVDYAIPDRITDGYGINQNLIQNAYDAGIDTIVTCDNGIAASEVIDYGKSLGLTIIVTDHHEIPYEEKADGEKCYSIPRADAVVNPKQAECEYRFDGICGAVVALKLIQVLYEEAALEKNEWENFIEIAAIATIGDVMILQEENRILVKKGLKSLRKTINLGLNSLMEINTIDKNKISAYHIGFVLGPCLNASGRLDTAQRAMELLLAETQEEAEEAARYLKGLNDSRKQMTADASLQAFEIIEHSQLKEDKVLIVYLPDCHESIAGIIAGRIRERYYKPVLVFTKTLDGVKASGRSIEGYHMFEELSKCRDLFTKFGGHAMAAGLSMKEENLKILRERLNSQTKLTDDDMVEKIHIDVPMPIDYITEPLLEQLQMLEPFGNGNPKPVFAERNISILRMEQKGRERKLLKMRITNNKCQMDAVYFGDIQAFEEFIKRQFGEQEIRNLYSGKVNSVNIAILYYPSINEFMGNRTIQVVIQDYCYIDK